MGINREQETGLRSALIAFGTMYEVLSEEGRVEVIVDIGNNNWFGAATVVRDETGYRMLSYPGTSGPEVFGRIVGQLTPEQVIEAARKHAVDQGYELPERSLNYLLENSKVPSRILLY